MDTDTCGLNDEKICRICYQSENPVSGKKDLISPCRCKGSIAFVHRYCLASWHYKGKCFKDISRCDQCLTRYKIKYCSAPNPILMHTLTLITCFFIIKVIECILKKISIFIEILLDYEEPLIAPNEPECLLYYKTLILTALVYQFVFDFGIISASNYIFTIWRLAQFNFLIDNCIALCITAYLIFRMYFAIYERLSILYVDWFNRRRWEVVKN